MRVLMEKLLATLQANHEWHQQYDEYGSYEDSDLCLRNCDALRAVKDWLNKNPPSG